MRYVKETIRIFERKERLWAITLFFGILIQGILEVAGIASIAPFLAMVADTDMVHRVSYLQLAYDYFEFVDDKQFLIAFGVVVIGVLVVTNAYRALMVKQITSFVKIIGHRLSVRLLGTYLSQSYLFFLNRNTSELGKNILTEVDRVVENIFYFGMVALSKVVLVLFLMVLLVIVDPWITVGVLVIIAGAYFLIYSIVQSRLKFIGEEYTVAHASRFTLTTEALSGIKDLKVKCKEYEYLSRYAKQSRRRAKYSAQSDLISQLPGFLIEAVVFSGIIVAIITFLVAKDSAGEAILLVTVFALSTYRIMPAAKSIYQGFSLLRYHLPALDILIRDLQISGGNRLDSRDDSKVLSISHSVNMNELSFFYPGRDAPAIKNITLSVEANSTVGLVGETGSGKTTLVDILLGLLPPTSGSLAVDGVSITQANVSSWQKNVGYVPQTIYLTDDTVERNIAFAVPEDEIDHRRVLEVARLAEINEFIDTLPDGINTYVGERGVRLSGGQRQRLGIARALYGDPQLIVFDEATSALDGITENVIMNAIHSLSHQKTIILIAHRLTTVKECDLIYMLNNAEIIDSGSFDDLMQRNKTFKKMSGL